MQEESSISSADLTTHLPLHLIPSESVPPVPTRSESAIDWLPDFGGYSWVAYGASSLLVISHFPSPLSQSESLIGPVFRQVIEISSDGSGRVAAVSWSPVSPSIGDVAAALANCIALFSHHKSDGSFCWSQTTVLLQSTNVEAIEWTGSGDGIISVGIEVILWKKRGLSWEIAWKFRPELPHTLVSATWSIDGHSATAPSCKCDAEGIASARKCVIVYNSDRKSKYEKAELLHPLPVSMIQWRPSTVRRQDVRHPPRLHLLTCCIDGTVRLWSEIDDARGRKVSKDDNDQRTRRLTFRVSSVLEINYAMNGVLGSDVHVRWATEINGIFNIDKETSQYFPSEDHKPDRVGRCEWLIGFGPQRMVSLWSIHCLDEISPVRYPRMTLWKREELKGPEVGDSSFLLRKVVIMRNQVFGPPLVCSFVQLLPHNSLSWFHLNFQISTSVNESLNASQAENLMSSCTNRTLNLESHSGNFVQVIVRSHVYESELAASLDAHGLIMLWSISNLSNCSMGLPTFKPSWKFIGKIDSGAIYTSMSWVLAVSDEDPILFAAHVSGVDCFIVKFYTHEEEKLCYHKLCTIPLTRHSLAEGPTSVYSVPLPSACDGTFFCDTSMLLAIWKNAFQALSWKISIHRCDFSGSCGCSFDTINTSENNELLFVSNVSGKRYFFLVDPWSSVMSDPHNQVTCYTVISPTNAVMSDGKKGIPVSELHYNDAAYHMVTGCFDGSLKLWRSMPSTSSNYDTQWDLVGVLDSHQGPITKVSLSDCGRKIATFTPACRSKSSGVLHVWEAVNLSVAGSFLLEDTIFLDGEVVALNWLTLGNGMLLLGVCLGNELHVYAHRRCGGQNLLNSKRSSNRKIWFCVALTRTCAANRNFFWGPKASAVAVHNEYFTLFSPWLLLVDKKSQPQSPSKFSYDSIPDFSASDNTFTEIFTDSDPFDLKESSVEEKDKHYVIKSTCKMNAKNDIMSSICAENFKQNYNLGINIGFWNMVDVAEILGGSLPLYHPEVLLMNIWSGNRKRALFALQNLIDYASSENIYFQRCILAKSGHVIPVVDLSNYLEGCVSSSSSNKTFLWGGDAALFTPSLQQQGPAQFISGWGSNDSNTSFTSPSASSKLSGFIELLLKLYDLGVITNCEKMQLFAITDLLHEISNSDSASVYESLDGPGRRFWVAIRFQRLYFIRRFGRAPSTEDLVVDSRMIGWAFHSDCQENLFNSLLPSEPSWQEMRNIGIGFWYTNAAQLRSKMEKLARQQYLKNKDPKACALLYIALNRLQVLAGLFKISKDEKDKPMVGFLSRNFQEDKNKAAALKNAYVLMGRHQLELAVAFFLLGGDASSAINVCAKNLGDEQLALVICRLVESYGGPLQCHLISKFMLPSAIEKGDYWLASYLEWALENYLKAFMSMLGFQTGTQNSRPALSSNNESFLDPSIGEYCLMLATSNNMRNAVGERNAMILGRWAILMSATALNKCGLPLEGLERLTSSPSIFVDSDQGNVTEMGNSELMNEMLMPSLSNSCLNWISTDVAIRVEQHAKLDMAMQFIIKLLREHPSSTDTNVGSSGSWTNSGSNFQYQMSLENFQNKLQAALVCFEQKFSLLPLHLIKKIVISLCSYGLVFTGYHILLWYTSKELSQKKRDSFGGFLTHPILSKILLKSIEEMAYLYSRYVVACSISCTNLKLCSTESSLATEKRFRVAGWQFYVQGLVWSLQNLRSTLKLFSISTAEGFISIPLNLLNLAEYYLYFASAWLQRNLKCLIILVRPILMTCHNGGAHHVINIENINKLLPDIVHLLAHNSMYDDVQASVQIIKQMQLEQDGNGMPSIPIDERWQILRTFLWGHLSDFLKDQLSPSSLTIQENDANFLPSGLISLVSDSARVELDSGNMEMQIGQIFSVLTKLIKVTCAQISSHCERQLASSLLQKMGIGSSTPTLKWFEEFIQIHHNGRQKPSSQSSDSLNMINNENELSDFEILWNICTDHKSICRCFGLKSSKWLQYSKQKPPEGWFDIYRTIEREHEAEECNRERKSGSPVSSTGVGSPVKVTSPDDNILLGLGVKDTTVMKKSMPFRSPKEICKRNGELLEALCINSINQQQGAIASNRKGIIFFNQENGLSSTNEFKYIWSEVDWPLDGWAGSESTPVLTCVSPGVGLGSRQGTHLGLGGATVGVGSLGKLGRDFTDGGSFGAAVNYGAGSPGLGWEIQDEFEEFVDPPATVENIRTTAFSSHPSKPLFLVGSSNTHIYLWKFGKERATATYGVLPAANVPPPYALASISAVRFDDCGQRFATAALDGTVCTWQLEVGGRSNICPTESSLCFNNYASDVTYVTASGSIIATAGYSSDAINVVVWDTLAPPSSSRASIMCHEGGARSISVFDNDVGSGSISPFIVTGGKGGDVGVHDFRYVATGRTKRHKHSYGLEEVTNGSSTTIMHNKVGDQNSNGMLWYIPKAHSGSVTRISAVPYTNYFLTGSKDGDVKLWDAKRAKLIFHWQKLHDRHTFLQGGVVRAAVTDIQVVSNGFLTCGGDGSVKLVQFQRVPGGVL